MHQFEFCGASARPSREAASEQIAVKSSYKESSFAWPNEWMKDCAFTVWLYDGYVHWETLACRRMPLTEPAAKKGVR